MVQGARQRGRSRLRRAAALLLAQVRCHGLQRLRHGRPIGLRPRVGPAELPVGLHGAQAGRHTTLWCVHAWHRHSPVGWSSYPPEQPEQCLVYPHTTRAAAACDPPIRACMHARMGCCLHSYPSSPRRRTSALLPPCLEADEAAREVGGGGVEGQHHGLHGPARQVRPRAHPRAAGRRRLHQRLRSQQRQTGGEAEHEQATHVVQVLSVLRCMARAKEPGGAHACNDG